MILILISLLEDFVYVLLNCRVSDFDSLHLPNLTLLCPFFAFPPVYKTCSFFPMGSCLAKVSISPSPDRFLTGLLNFCIQCILVLLFLLWICCWGTSQFCLCFRRSGQSALLFINFKILQYNWIYYSLCITFSKLTSIITIHSTSLIELLSIFFISI